MFTGSLLLKRCAAVTVSLAIVLSSSESHAVSRPLWRPAHWPAVEALATAALWERAGLQEGLAAMGRRLAGHPVTSAAAVSGAALAAGWIAGLRDARLWQSASTLGGLVFAGLVANQSSPFDLRSWIGRGDYRHRRFSTRFREPLNAAYPDPAPWTDALPDYPFVLSTRDEAARLLKTLLPEADPVQAARWAPLQSQWADLDDETLTRLLQELRLTWLTQDLRVRGGEWQKASHEVERQLHKLAHRSDGPWVIARVLHLLQILERKLPIADLAPVDGSPHVSLDNLQRYFLDIEHGLAHSLDVLVDVLDGVDTVLKNEGQRRSAAEVLIGIALIHDLTGLRDRYQHHETARDLAVAVLDGETDVEGRPMTRAYVNAVARGSQNHRGQKYPPPEDLPEELFVDFDEFNLLKDLGRILRQPANGVFQPDFWDVYRDMSLREERRPAGGGPFKHETDYADLFQYLLMTLIERTNPAVYRTSLVQHLVRGLYPSIRGAVFRIMRTWIQNELAPGGRPSLESMKRYYRMKSVILELEALRGIDPTAKATLRREIGSPGELYERVARLIRRSQDHPAVRRKPAPYSKAAKLLDLMNGLRSHRRTANEQPQFPEARLSDVLQPDEVFARFDFKLGLALMDFYLENPFFPIQSAIDALHQAPAPGPRSLWPPILAAVTALPGDQLRRQFAENPFASLRTRIERETAVLRATGERPSLQLHYVYAGLAEGLAQVVAYRVRRLYDMISFDPVSVADVRDRQDLVLGRAMAQRFLARLHAGLSPNEAMVVARHELDSLRFGPTRPETWDAPFADIDALYRSIQTTPKATFHLHTSGALTFEQAAALYRRHPDAVRAFRRQFKDIDPTSAEDLRQFQNSSEVDSAVSFERAFIPGHVLLNNDPTLAIHREWYAQIVRNADAEHTALVGTVSTFAQEHCTEKQFRHSVLAAIEGLEAGEAETGGRVQTRLLLAIRKSASPDRALELVRWWLSLKNDLSRRAPERAAKIFGVDSVGYEDGWTFERHREAFELAHGQGIFTKVHVGEFWQPGQLVQALERVATVVRHPSVDQITNAVSLFVFPDPRSMKIEYYDDQDCEVINDLQHDIWSVLRSRQMFVELSPKGNDLLSRFLRAKEGWEFRRVDSVMAMGVPVLVTEDDPGPYDTTLSLEFLQLYLGWTAFGGLSFDYLGHLLNNGQWLLKRFGSQGAKPLDRSSPQWPSHLLPALAFLILSPFAGLFHPQPARVTPHALSAAA